MSRMSRMEWRRVAERVGGVWETGEVVRQEVLEVKQKPWVGMRGEVGEDSDSLEAGRTEPFCAIRESLTLCFQCCRCRMSEWLFELDTEAVQIITR